VGSGSSVGFGVLGGLVVGGDLSRRSQWAAVTVIACFAIGLFTSEVWFGWADEEELQPNYDGLSFDEALLSGVVTTALVVFVARRLAHRSGHGSGQHRAPGIHVLGPRH
jgi:hypothetical protein